MKKLIVFLTGIVFVFGIMAQTKVIVQQPGVPYIYTSTLDSAGSDTVVFSFAGYSDLKNLMIQSAVDTTGGDTITFTYYRTEISDIATGVSYQVDTIEGTSVISSVTTKTDWANTLLYLIISNGAGQEIEATSVIKPLN